MEQNFIINLVSNASMQVFPTNTMARFTTLLPQKIELTGEWEVAVLEVSWPAKVKNITNASFTLSRFDNNTPSRPMHNQTIPEGYYPTIDTLVEKLLKTVYQKNENFPVSWKIDPVSEKLKMVFTGQKPEDQFIMLFKSEDLSNTLGIRDTICCTLGNNRAVEGTYPVDIQGGRHTIFLYCDLIQNEILGDVQTALLRVIPLHQTDSAATCYRSFNKLQWKRLSKTNFQSVTISLCDESGQPMPFVSIGRTNLTLAFRQRKQQKSFL